MEKQKEKLLQLLQEAEKENGIEAKADFLIEKGVMIPPVQIGQTVYSLGKKHSKCRIGVMFDEFMCQGCEIECDSHTTYFVQEEIVTQLVWCGSFWRVDTNKTSLLQSKGIEESFEYDIFLSPKKIFEEIERREKEK